MKKLFSFLLGLSLIILTTSSLAEDQNKIAVGVSIAPIKYCLEQIGGDRIAILTLVKTGQNPETFEPQPNQIAALTKADIYLQLHLPFEEALLNKIKPINPQLQIIDLRSEIKLRSLDGGVDPHVWNSPIIMQQIAKTISSALIKADHKNADYYAKNYQSLITRLKLLDHTIKHKLAKLKTRTFLVFHPAWGYFADAYNLQQVAIETEGKEAGPRDLKKIMDFARQNHVTTIFVQPQFSKTQAQAIAGMLQAKLVILDPLAANYLSNLNSVATSIADNLKLIPRACPAHKAMGDSQGGEAQLSPLGKHGDSFPVRSQSN